MISLTLKEVETFKKQGWVKTQMNLPDNLLSFYQNSAAEMVTKAKIENYKFGRIYFDYLFDYNLAAIELPLNKSICNKGIYELFENIKIGSAVNKLLESSSSICLLNRLFCMKDYKYTGHMHQDTREHDKRVQVMIYLNDEAGFKIFKKEYEHKIKEIFNGGELENSPNFNLPFIFNEEYLETINARRGEVLFFDPAIPHQGIYKNNRLTFHMRFDKFDPSQHKNFSKNEKLDFVSIKEYDENLDINNIPVNFPKISRNKISKRLSTSINYLFPILNFLRLIKIKNNSKYKNINFNIFSNTAYQ